MKNYLHFLSSYLHFLSPLHAEKPGWDVAARQPLPVVSAGHRMSERISKHFIPFVNQILTPMKPMARFLFLLLLLSQASCKKDKSPDPGPLYIPQEVKDYAQFKPGTYWVYIDSVSGRVDSQYVFYLKKGYDTLTIYDNPSRAYEWFETAVHSEMDGYDYFRYCSSSYSSMPDDKYIVFVSKSKPGKYVGKTKELYYKPYKGMTWYDGPAIKTVKEFYPTFNLNGITYSEVFEIYQDKSYIEVCNNVTYFLAKDFGIIRKEMPDSNQVWVLARSNIIQ